MNKKENPHTFRYRGFPCRLAAAGAVGGTAARTSVLGDHHVEVLTHLDVELLQRQVQLLIAVEGGNLDEEEDLGHCGEHLVVDLVSVHDTNLCYLCS